MTTKSPENSEIDLLVWDLETTGFTPPECKILEIGALIVRGDEVEEKHWVLDNKVEIPENIIEITGITPEIVAAEGRDPRECLEEFLPLFKSAKRNVTHNGIRFDIPFLVGSAAAIFGYTEEEKRNVLQFIRQRAFDTAVVYKASQLDMRPGENEPFYAFGDRVMEIRAYGVKYTLGLCCDEYKVSREGVIQHRALGDVGLTHLLYKAMLPHFEAQESIYDKPPF